MKLIRKAVRKVKSLFADMKSRFDKQGSYTGTADENGSKKPEQDADDL